jgi:hypothetical protein
MSSIYETQLQDMLSTHHTIGAGEDEDEMFLTSGDDEDRLYDAILGAKDEAAIVSRIASFRIPAMAKLSPAARARLMALSSGAKLVRRIAEVNNARQALRPNSYCPFTSTPLNPLPGVAPQVATGTITIQPGGGNGYWKFLGFYIPDYFHNLFAFTSLQIAGQEVIYGTSTSTASAPANAVSCGVFNSRSPNVFNLTPWMGQTFSNTQNIVIQVTTTVNAGQFLQSLGGDAAAGTAIAATDTLTLTGAVLTQVDPCDVSLPGVDRKLSRRQISGAMRNALSFMR